MALDRLQALAGCPAVMVWASGATGPLDGAVPDVDVARQRGCATCTGAALRTACRVSHRD